MKHPLIVWFCALLLISATESVRAQDPSFAVYVDNPIYVTQNQFEFDVMVKAIGATTTFQLRTFQAGIFIDSAWVGSGSLTISNVLGTTQLSVPGYNGNFQWNATDKIINCSVNLGVRTSSGSCVSTSIGTAPLRIARLRVVNSSAFACIAPNIKFNYTQNASPLRLRTSVSWRQAGCTVNYDMYYPNRPYTGQAYFNGELYSATDADGKSPASTIANSIPCSVPFNLTVFIEGFYLGAGAMQPVLANSGVAGVSFSETDSILVELRDVTDPSIIVSTLTGILTTSGNATFVFPSNTANNSYWLVVKHRNSVETWSAAPIAMSTGGTYDFSDNSNKAYGDNLAFVGNGVYAIYSGDMNQDQFIDPFDYPIYDIDNLSFMSGYNVSDLNGDGFTDTYDYSFYDKNALDFISAILP